MTIFIFSLVDTLAMEKPQAILSEEAADEMEGDNTNTKEEPRLRRPVSKRDSASRSLSASDGNNTSMQQNNIGNFSFFEQSIVNVNYIMLFVALHGLEFPQEKWQLGE